LIEITEDKNAARIGLIALRDSFHCTLEDIKTYEVKAIKKENTIIGSVFYKGPEVHVAILNKYRRKWISKRIIREILCPLFIQYGYAVTMGFEKDRDFLERIGFKEQFKINDVIHYRIMP